MPRNSSDERWGRNRRDWNRYFAAKLDNKTCARLIAEKRHTEEELTPFSQEQLKYIETDFAERCTHLAQKPILPKCDSGIHFDGVQFDEGVTFEGYLFTDCSFKDAIFLLGVNANFRNASFSGWNSFENVIFNGWADFDRTSFPADSIIPIPDTTFRGAAFLCGASFRKASFAGNVRFDYTTTFGDETSTSSGETSFWGATFSGDADFQGARFHHKVSFDGARFQWPKFNGVTFRSDVWFNDAVFGATHFDSATFEKSCSFVNAKMKGETFFDGAKFLAEPPRFFNAKLHQGTVWRGIKDWPKPKIKDNAGRFIDAYACLKAEMDRIKKHEDELDFFALELQSRRVLLGPWWGLPICVYGVLSAYGRSYMRPLVAIIVIVFIGAWAFWCFDARTFAEALGLSAANTLNVFGFCRDFNLAIDTPFASLKVFAALQTILGAIFLFLCGVGIRNKFRMK